MLLVLGRSVTVTVRMTAGLPCARLEKGACFQPSDMHTVEAVAVHCDHLLFDVVIQFRGA